MSKHASTLPPALSGRTLTGCIGMSAHVLNGRAPHTKSRTGQLAQLAWWRGIVCGEWG